MPGPAHRGVEIKSQEQDWRVGGRSGCVEGTESLTRPEGSDFVPVGMSRQRSPADGGMGEWVGMGGVNVGGFYS